jgi:hypothetical protein
VYSAATTATTRRCRHLCPLCPLSHPSPRSFLLSHCNRSFCRNCVKLFLKITRKNYLIWRNYYSRTALQNNVKSPTRVWCSGECEVWKPRIKSCRPWNLESSAVKVSVNLWNTPYRFEDSNLIRVSWTKLQTKQNSTEAIWWLMTDNWWLMANDWWLVIDDWWLMTGDWWLMTVWWLMTGDWWLMTDDWWLMTDDWWLTTGDRWLMTEDWWLITADWWLMTDDWLNYDWWLMTDDWWLMTDDWWLMTDDWCDDWWLMTDDRWLMTDNCGLWTDDWWWWPMTEDDDDWWLMTDDTDYWRPRERVFECETENERACVCVCVWGCGGARVMCESGMACARECLSVSQRVCACVCSVWILASSCFEDFPKSTCLFLHSPALFLFECHTT